MEICTYMLIGLAENAWYVVVWTNIHTCIHVKCENGECTCMFSTTYSMYYNTCSYFVHTERWMPPTTTTTTTTVWSARACLQTVSIWYPPNFCDDRLPIHTQRLRLFSVDRWIAVAAQRWCRHRAPFRCCLLTSAASSLHELQTRRRNDNMKMVMMMFTVHATRHMMLEYMYIIYASLWIRDNVLYNITTRRREKSAHALLRHVCNKHTNLLQRIERRDYLSIIICDINTSDGFGVLCVFKSALLSCHYCTIMTLCVVSQKQTDYHQILSQQHLLNISITKKVA